MGLVTRVPEPRLLHRLRREGNGHVLSAHSVQGPEVSVFGLCSLHPRSNFLNGHLIVSVSLMRHPGSERLSIAGTQRSDGGG